MRYLIVVLLALASCKTTRNVQKFARQVDSTGFFKRDSSRVVRIDSVGVSKDKVISNTDHQNDYEQWTVIEEYEDTTPAALQSAIQIARHIITKRTTTHIRDKGRTSSKIVTVSKDSSSTHKVDSATGSTIAVTRVLTDEKGKDLQVKKTQGGLWINLGILVLILAALYYVYRKYLR
jgi:hypothetical protein